MSVDLKGPSSMSVVVNVAVAVCLYAREMRSAVEVKRPACPPSQYKLGLGHTDVLNVLQSSLFSQALFWKKLCPHLRGPVVRFCACFCGYLPHSIPEL